MHGMDTVAGIDVGGLKKGFHAVALRGATVIDRLSSADPAAIAAWCNDHQAKNIAVDAPCGWSRDGRSRACERALMAQGIWCFSTPLRTKALTHPKNQFGWMLAGEALYAAIAKTHSLFTGRWDDETRFCVETFPHAVVCSLSGTVVSAKNKGSVRRNLLLAAGIDASQLPNIDFVDAALCAVVAEKLRWNAIESLGSPADGLIVVPQKLVHRDQS